MGDSAGGALGKIEPETKIGEQAYLPLHIGRRPSLPFEPGKQGEEILIDVLMGFALRQSRFHQRTGRGQPRQPLRLIEKAGRVIGHQLTGETAQMFLEPRPPDGGNQISRLIDPT